MKKTFLAVAVALISLVPTGAHAAMRGFAGVRFGGWYAPYYGGWYSPYWGPYYGTPFYGGSWYAPPNSGNVKLDTKVKTAQVYVDGAYAGTTGENKSLRLRPGAHNIEVREAGHANYDERVYVVAGKTLHLSPAL